MFSEKLEYYARKPCKWLNFYLNLAWPLMIAYSLIMLIFSAVFWNNNSAVIIVTSFYTIVGLLLSDLYVRLLNPAGLIFWFVGNVTPIITNIVFLIMASNSVVQDAMTAQPTVGSTLSFIGNTFFLVLYSAFALAFIVHGAVMLIINTVYIINRKDLFLTSEYSIIIAAKEYDESL